MYRQGLFLLLCGILVMGCGTKDTLTSTKEIKNMKVVEPTDQERYDLMLGKWYGHQPTEDGRTRQELMVRATDGTYFEHFITCNADGTFDEQKEVGHWGVSGSIYFTMFRGWVKATNQFQPSDPSNANNYDGYTILELTNDMMRYRSVVNGYEYTLKKMPYDFELTSTMCQ